MLMRLAFGVLGLAIAVPANAQSDLEKGFAGALRGCEEWVLNPASWSEGIDPFVATVGLGDKMGLVESVNRCGAATERATRRQSLLAEQ